MWGTMLHWHLAPQLRVQGLELSPLDVRGRGRCLHGVPPLCCGRRWPQPLAARTLQLPVRASLPCSGMRTRCAEGRSPPLLLLSVPSGPGAVAIPARSRCSVPSPARGVPSHRPRLLGVCLSVWRLSCSPCLFAAWRCVGSAGPVESSLQGPHCSWVMRVSSRQGRAAEGPAHDRPGFWHQRVFALPDKAHILLPHQQHPSPDGSRRVLARTRGQGEHPLSSAGARGLSVAARAGSAWASEHLPCGVSVVGILGVFLSNIWGGP